MTWWNRENLCRYDGILCDGAVRSGKTLAMTVGFFLWAMTCFQGKTFALGGKTIGALRRNIVVHLSDWLGGVFQITEHRTDNCLIVRLAGRENTFYLFGGQDAQSHELIQGMTLAGVFLDEAAIMPRTFVEQACARCSEPGSKLWLNCNPGSPQHWLYVHWIQKAQQKNLLHLHFTMEDNPALDDRVRRRYEELYEGAFYRRYVLGQWCDPSGLVYAFDPRCHVTRQIPDRGRWFLSVDYGTQNPFSAGLWCVEGSCAVRIREYYYDGRAAGIMKTDDEYHRALEELAGDAPVELVVIDPSAASLIALIRRRGVFRVRKAKNAVLPGIQAVARMLRSGNLRIGADCTQAIREFSLYRWQEGQDLPVKQDDHAMDEIRYFAMTVMRRLV